MFHTINSTVAFTALSQVEQAAIWTTFFEAIDEGCMGAHPLYGVLAPLYAAGDYLCEAAVDEIEEARLASAAPLSMGQMALAVEAGLDGVVPPF